MYVFGATREAAPFAQSTTIRNPFSGTESEDNK